MARSSAQWPPASVGTATSTFSGTWCTGRRRPTAGLSSPSSTVRRGMPSPSTLHSWCKNHIYCPWRQLPTPPSNGVIFGMEISKNNILASTLEKKDRNNHALKIMVERRSDTSLYIMVQDSEEFARALPRSLYKIKELGLMIHTSL